MINLLETSIPRALQSESARLGIEVGGMEMLNSISNEWRQLCDHATNDEPFYRPEWISAHLKAFEPGAEFRLVVAREKTEIQAVLPLVFERTHFCGLPVIKYRSVTNRGTFRFDLLRRSGSEGASGVRNIWQFFRAMPGWDVIEIASVPENGATEDLLQLARQDGFMTGSWEADSSPYVNIADLEGADTYYLSKQYKRFRADLRRELRNISKLGTLSLDRIDNADGRDLDDFFRLESSGWKGTNKTDIISKGQKTFFEEIAQKAAEMGYLSFYMLRLDGRTIAAHFGLSYKGTYYSPKIAYDENYRRFGPGQLLIEMILKECIDRDLSKYEILGAPAKYKAMWTCRLRRHFFHYIFCKRPYGHLLHTLKFRMIPLMKKLPRQGMSPESNQR